MTVAVSTAREDYVGNGATKTYAYNFKIASASELRVALQHPTTYAITLLTLNADYTVAGVGAASGGTITLVDADQAWLDADGDLVTGWKLAIRRNADIAQDVDFSNGGDFFGETHEDALDKLARLIQQMQEQLKRCVKFPETEAGGSATEISAASARANKQLGFDASGNPIAATSFTPGVTATAYIQTFLDDADAAAARATLGFAAAMMATTSPAQITANQNDYAAAVDATAIWTLARLSTDATRTITGLAGGANPKAITIVNRDAQLIVLAHESSSSSAANRLTNKSGRDLTLAPGDTATYIYDATSSRWRQIDADPLPAFVDQVAVGNVGAGEDDLVDQAVPANTLNRNGKHLRITFWGTKANNANAKTLKVYAGATLLQSYSLAASEAGVWKVVVEFVRTGSNAQKFCCQVTDLNDTVVASGTAALTDTAAITFKVTGEATANDDIKCEECVVECVN